MGLVHLARSLLERNTRIDPRSLRGVRPARNSFVVYASGGGGEVFLEAPLVQTQGLIGSLARATGKPTSKRFELEPVGAFVWSLCDGAITFEKISQRLCGEFKMSRAEAEAALAAFLQMLLERGLITLNSPKRK